MMSRLVRRTIGCIVLHYCVPLFGQDIFFQQNDLVLGLSQSIGTDSIEQVRGPSELEGGEFIDQPYDAPGIQSIEFDNFNGISHNPTGNLLGVVFSQGDGGQIYRLRTSGAVGEEGVLIGDTVGHGGDDLTATRLGGISVSPDNSKISVNGYDSGAVIVYDYDSAANSPLTGGREITEVLTSFATQGTTWLNPTTVLAFSSLGDLVSVNADAMSTTILASFETGGGPASNRSEFTDIEYDPLVSPYLFATYSGFDRDTNATINTLFVLDPRDDFSTVKIVDNSNSMNTSREIAIDSNGNLFASEFGANVELIGNVVDPATLTDNATLDWYMPINGNSFSGIDIALGLAQSIPMNDGDFDNDGTLDAVDINLLTEEIRKGNNDLSFDLTNDGSVNGQDRRAWVVDLKKTYFGDSNLNGVFDTGDLIAVFEHAEYEDGVAGNSNWEEGDWDGDGDFGTSDLVFVFSEAGFEQGPRAVESVPESISLDLFAMGLLMMCRHLRLVRTLPSRDCARA